MNLLPKASGSRPRLACEIFAGGVVAARSPEPGLPLSAVGKAELAASAVVPSLKPGNIADRTAVISALRRVLEQVGGRSNARNSDLTLVIPDAAVRVLLLDFDALPNKLSEALPIVRFRLKKLLPFEAEDAMVSFQVMSTSRSLVRVLAVAIPPDVLREYESVAREAGFEPGAVLPSTLATLAALEEGDGASLVVNAHELGVTTAIVRAGILLLHRTVELAEYAPALPPNVPAILFETSAADDDLLPLVDREVTAQEWAAQQPEPQYGRDPYGTRAAFQNDVTASPARSPYASSTVSADLAANLHNSILDIPTADGRMADPSGIPDLDSLARYAADPEPPVHTLSPEVQAEEIASAVSVAVAYFEDSLGAVPEALLSAGPLGADALNRMLREQAVGQEAALRVRELMDAAALASPATTASVSRGWLAGVAGALKS